MNAQHTPGLWEVHEDWRHGREVDGPLYDVVADGTEIALHVESETDARLIAAAPELLEALGKCVALLEQLLQSDPEQAVFIRAQGYTGHAAAIGRAAIAKAEGRGQ